MAGERLSGVATATKVGGGISAAPRVSVGSAGFGRVEGGIAASFASVRPGVAPGLGSRGPEVRSTGLGFTRAPDVLRVRTFGSQNSLRLSRPGEGVFTGPKAAPGERVRTDISGVNRGEGLINRITNVPGVKSVLRRTGAYAPTEAFSHTGSKKSGTLSETRALIADIVDTSPDRGGSSNNPDAVRNVALRNQSTGEALHIIQRQQQQRQQGLESRVLAERTGRSVHIVGLPSRQTPARRSFDVERTAPAVIDTKPVNPDVVQGTVRSEAPVQRIRRIPIRETRLVTPEIIKRTDVPQTTEVRTATQSKPASPSISKAEYATTSLQQPDHRIVTARPEAKPQIKRDIRSADSWSQMQRQLMQKRVQRGIAERIRDQSGSTDQTHNPAQSTAGTSVNNPKLMWFFDTASDAWHMAVVKWGRRRPDSKFAAKFGPVITKYLGVDRKLTTQHRASNNNEENDQAASSLARLRERIGVYWYEFFEDKDKKNKRRINTTKPAAAAIPEIQIVPDAAAIPLPLEELAPASSVEPEAAPVRQPVIIASTDRQAELSRITESNAAAGQTLSSNKTGLVPVTEANTDQLTQQANRTAEIELVNLAQATNNQSSTDKTGKGKIFFAEDGKAQSNRRRDGQAAIIRSFAETGEETIDAKLIAAAIPPYAVPRTSEVLLEQGSGYTVSAKVEEDPTDIAVRNEIAGAGSVDIREAQRVLEAALINNKPVKRGDKGAGKLVSRKEVEAVLGNGILARLAGMLGLN